VLELLVAHLPVEGRSQDVASTLGNVPTAVYPMRPSARADLHATLKAQSDLADKFLPEMSKLVAELRAMLGLQPDAADTWSGGIAGFLGGAANLRATLDKLEARYPEVAALTKQPFDDRYFFSAPMPAPVAHAAQDAPSTADFPMSPPRAPAGTPKHSSALFTPLRGSNPLAAPHTPMMMQTPISGHFDCVSWLRAAVAGLSADNSSESLAAFFDECEPDPADAIKRRLDRLCILLGDLLEDSELDSDVGEQLAHGRQLYYKMLLSFLEAEELRLRSKSFVRTLLAQENFHTALFACCMEAVFASYSLTDLAFPGVIDAFQLKPFDFYKVIEGFVRNDPDLPKFLRRHFRDLEVKVLESLAWADDSPLHSLTAEYDQQVSPPGGSAPGPARAKAALSSFLKKVEYVAASRVHDMCTRLLLRTPLVIQVWECIKAVIQTPARHLLVGRHLDQIIMCTIYGVCKVNKRPDEESKTFRHIIEQYKRQEKASAKVFREVRMGSSGDPPQDIIAFYNKIFIPSMKDHLLRVLKEVSEERTAPSSHMSPSPLAPLGSVARSMASPQRVIGGRDVWVSHPRTPSASMTPRTRLLYAFGDSPGSNLGRLDSLQRVNHQLNSGPTDGSVAANALRALSTTPSRSGTPSRSPGARSGLMPAPPPEMPSRKRSLEGGGMSRKQLQRRLNDDVAMPERSSSNGSNGSSSPEGGAPHSNGSA
jgi:retinoblastoma-associated protein